MDFRDTVMEGIGEASMCWTETPGGTYESDYAISIGEKIIKAHNKEQEYLRSELVRLMNENTTFRNILEDFLETKESRETWIAEMYGTIDAVLKGE